VPFPNDETKFRAGQSGNPAGYSRGRRQTDDLLRLIEEAGATRAISKVWLKAILEGNVAFLREYLDRTEGKSPDTLKIDDGGEVQPRINPKRRSRPERAGGSPVDRGDGERDASG